MSIGRDIWDRRCNITRVIDGDTVYVRIDDGRRHYSDESIRLLDVDAAEIFTGTAEERALGSTHKVILEMWVVNHANHIESSTLWPFFLRTYQDKQSFNRYIGEIECIEGHSLNADMRTAIALG